MECEGDYQRLNSKKKKSLVKYEYKLQANF